MRGIKITLALCLVTLMICDQRSFGDRANEFKDKLKEGKDKFARSFDELKDKFLNKFDAATENFHFQEKLDSAKEFFAGLKSKFNDASLKAKAKFSEAAVEIELTSRKLLSQLDEWKKHAIAKAQEKYNEVKDSEVFASNLAKIQKSFNEKSAAIKTFAEDKISQLKSFFNKKQEEEKALLELF